MEVVGKIFFSKEFGVVVRGLDNDVGFVFGCCFKNGVGCVCVDDIDGGKCIFVFFVGLD